MKLCTRSKLDLLKAELQQPVFVNFESIMRLCIFVFGSVLCFNQAAATSQDQDSGISSLMDYLSGKHNRKLLEFSEKQESEFGRLQKEYAEAYQELNADFLELRNNKIPSKAREELTRKVRLEGQKLRTQFGKELKDLLVPRQFELISSLKFKQVIESYGFAYAVSNPPYANRLKTTAEQKKELAIIHRDTQKVIQEKIKELKAEAEKKMIKVFDSKQRKLLRSMQGESEK